MTRVSPSTARALLARLLSDAPGMAPEAHSSRAKARKARKASTPRLSPGEQAFDAALRLHGRDLAAPTPEHHFHPVRKWRFDFAWEAQRVAVEIDGGQWKANGGRHNTDADRDKLNHAAALGWRILRFSPQQVERDPVGCVALLRSALEAHL